MQPSPELLATLPPVLKGVVKALGVRRGIEWLCDHGGVVIKLPKYHTTALGLNSAEVTALNAELAPHLDHTRRISLPKADKLLIRARNAEIRRTAHRMSISDQARYYGLTSRHITSLRGDVETAQLDMFAS